MSLLNRLRGRSQKEPQLSPTAFEKALIVQQQQARQLVAGEVSAIDPRADQLNQQALHLYNSGQTDQAETTWEEALIHDPHHPETVYNQGLLRWRRGQITDALLVEHLEKARKIHGDSPRTRLLLALVHLERGAMDAALPLLETAARQAPGDTALQNLLTQAQSGSLPRFRFLHCFEGHTEPVNAVCLSPDGHLAFSAGDDRTVRMWEVSSGRCLRVLRGHDGFVSSVWVSADGRWVMSGGKDATLRLWEVASGRCLRTFSENMNDVYSVCMSDDALLAVSGGIDKVVRFWEVETGQLLKTM